MNMIWAAGKYIREDNFTALHFRETKPFGGVKWHPGSYGHHLLASYHAYHYSSFIEDSIKKMHEVLDFHFLRLPS